ncbi:MAG: hypothetical protein M3331_04190 [Actinomycetota bacterium]|nr:hypothetical protein [Actinomycetota bacterium]
MRSTTVPQAGRPALGAILAAAGALALAACGSDSSADESGAEPVGQELGGSVAQLAQCSDWVEGTRAEKLATIEDIRSQVNREDAGVTASELSDERAMEVFDNGCAQPYAGGYRLQVMYGRAAAFEPLREVAEGEAEPPAD